MILKKRIPIVCLTLIFVGCTTQPPAPVFSSGSTIPKSVPRNTPPSKQQKPAETAPIVETKPLKDYDNFTRSIQEFSTQPIESYPSPDSVAPIDQKSRTPSDSESSDFSSETESTLDQTTSVFKSEKAPKITSAPKGESIDRPEVMAFEPFEASVFSSPAIGALVANANQNSKSGDLDQAVTTIERAIRIEPRNPDLYYKLAVIRLKQSKPRLAEDLAKKSALLASANKPLKKHSWLLIAKAREMQKDYAGSKEARSKASGF